MPNSISRALRTGALVACPLVLSCCATPTDQPLRELVSELSPGATLLSPPRATPMLGSDGANKVLIDNAGAPVPSFLSRTLVYKDMGKFAGEFDWLKKYGARIGVASEAGGTAELTNVWVRELRDPIPDINSAVFRAAVGAITERKTVRLGPVCRLEIGCEAVSFSGAAGESINAAAKASLEQAGIKFDASTKTARSGQGDGSNLVLANEFAYVTVDCTPTADKPGGATMDLGDGYRVQVTDVNTEAAGDAPQYTLRVSQFGKEEVVTLQGRFGFTQHMLVSSAGTVTGLQINWYGTGGFKYSKTEFLSRWMR